MLRTSFVTVVFVNRDERNIVSIQLYCQFCYLSRKGQPLMNDNEFIKLMEDVMAIVIIERSWSRQAWPVLKDLRLLGHDTRRLSIDSEDL